MGEEGQRNESLAELAARLGMRVSQRWEASDEDQAQYANDHACRRMMSGDTDIQIASRVRMLMRDDLDHEAVVCVARDRLCALAVEKADLLEALKEAAEFIQPFNRAADLYDKIEAAISRATGGEDGK